MQFYKRKHKYNSPTWLLIKNSCLLIPKKRILFYVKIVIHLLDEQVHEKQCL